MRTFLALSLALMTISSATYCQTNFSSYKDFALEGGYSIGDITIIKDTYPEPPIVARAVVNGRCLGAGFMVEKSEQITAQSFNRKRDLKAIIKKLPSTTSPEVKAELQSLSSVSLKINKGSRIFYTNGYAAAFSQFVSKLCKAELQRLLDFQKNNSKAFVIVEVLKFEDAKLTFGSTSALSAEASQILIGSLGINWFLDNNAEIVFAGTSTAKYKGVRLREFRPEIEQAIAKLGSSECPAFPVPVAAQIPATDHQNNPSLVSGDSEFYGNGPKMTIHFEFVLSDDRTTVTANYTVDGLEWDRGANRPAGDQTHGNSTRSIPYYTAPPGMYISSFPPHLISYHAMYIDTTPGAANDSPPIGGPVGKILCTGDMGGADVGVPGGTGCIVWINAIPIQLQDINCK